MHNGDLFLIAGHEPVIIGDVPDDFFDLFAASFPLKLLFALHGAKLELFEGRLDTVLRLRNHHIFVLLEYFVLKLEGNFLFLA